MENADTDEVTLDIEVEPEPEPAKVEIDQAAEAFARLEGEMALMRRAVQHLAAERADIVIPDYGPTLTEMTKRLGAIAGSIGDIAEHPAMQVTPDGFGGRIEAAAQAARRDDQGRINDAHNELRQAAQDMRGVTSRARTTAEFSWDCISYYLANTGIPVNFGITIVIAIIIGLVVSGQTFYLFTIENLKQFGALKAIGVTNARLTGMILLQALVVGFTGYALGTGMAAIFFETFSKLTATRGIVLLWQSAAGVAVLMLGVVVLASLLSIRRVLVLEPAAVFR